MPLNNKEIAMTVAVLTFFLISIIASLNGVSPEICCKRSLVGMFITYITVSMVIRFINYLVIDAMASKQAEKIMEKLRKTNGSAN